MKIAVSSVAMVINSHPWFLNNLLLAVIVCKPAFWAMLETVTGLSNGDNLEAHFLGTDNPASQLLLRMGSKISSRPGLECQTVGFCDDLVFPD